MPDGTGRHGALRRAAGLPGRCHPCAYGVLHPGCHAASSAGAGGVWAPVWVPVRPGGGVCPEAGELPHGPGETGGMDSTGTLRWSAIAHIKFDTCRKRVKSPCPKTGSVTPVTLLGACQRPACHRAKTERLADGQETVGLWSSVRVVSAPVPVVGTGAAEGARRAPGEPPGPPGPGDVLSRPSRPPERPSAHPALAPLPQGPRLPDGLLAPAPRGRSRAPGGERAPTRGGPAPPEAVGAVPTDVTAVAGRRPRGPAAAPGPRVPLRACARSPPGGPPTGRRNGTARTFPGARDPRAGRPPKRTSRRRNARRPGSDDPGLRHVRS